MCSEEEEYRWTFDQEEWESHARSVDVLRSEVEDLAKLVESLRDSMTHVVRQLQAVDARTTASR